MLCISNDIYAKEVSMINKITQMIDDLRCDENELSDSRNNACDIIRNIIRNFQNVYICNIHIAMLHNFLLLKRGFYCCVRTEIT